MQWTCIFGALVSAAVGWITGMLRCVPVSAKSTNSRNDDCVGKFPLESSRRGEGGGDRKSSKSSPRAACPSSPRNASKPKDASSPGGGVRCIPCYADACDAFDWCDERPSDKTLIGARSLRRQMVTSVSSELTSFRGTLMDATLKPRQFRPSKVAR